MFLIFRLEIYEQLHNQDEIKRKDIRINDIAIIQRAGDVIPQVTGIDLSKRPENSQKFIFPKNCPVCNSQVVKIENDIVLRCSGGLSCQAQLKETLKHFVSKDAFDITWLGKKQIETFLAEGRINSFADIFNLQKNEKIREEINNNALSQKIGWGEKSIENLYKAIEEKRKISLNRFIYAIGIRHVGQITAKILANHFTSFENLKNTILSLSKIDQKYIDSFQKKNLSEIPNEIPSEFKEILNKYSDLEAIDGIGTKMTNAILDYFRDERNLKMFLDVADELQIEDFQDKKSNSEFSGKTIIFTGSLENMTRAEAKKRAEDLGFKVVGSISAKTNYVVFGDKAGSKLKKAQELNLQILSEEAWLEILNKNG